MKKNVITTGNSPRAIGAYSQAIKVGNIVYTSGQIPINPKTLEIYGNNAGEQTKMALENLTAVLIEAGGTLDSIVKTTVFISNMDNFEEINTVYSQFFTKTFPARSCVEVSRLPKDVLVEIEAVAYL